jgi:predicted esterase
MEKLHSGQPVLTHGAPLGKARAAMIMIHGRGATAYDILSLSTYLTQEHVAFMAPQAANSVWYPLPFTQPLANNEPWYGSTMSVVDGLVGQALAAGIPAEKVMLLGFSQGAVTVLEYALRHPRRYCGVIGLSGSLMVDTQAAPPTGAGLAQTPVFLGCSDVDSFFKIEFIHKTEQIMAAAGGAVTKRIYPGMSHTVNEDEIEVVNAMLKAAVAGN